MQAPVRSDRSSEANPSAVGGVDLVYNLRSENGCSDRFYVDVARFADRLLSEIESRAASAISGYSHFVQIERHEAPRSRGECGIELLTRGLVLRRYARAAQSTSRWTMKLARKLFELRHKSAWIKAVADQLRAAITGLFLAPKIGCRVGPDCRTLNELPRLIDWLRATGEFEQQSDRLENWRSYLSLLSEMEANRCLAVSTELFDWFRRESEEVLGVYTRGVPYFLAGEHRRRGWREDQIFCSKAPVEYHLNMVATEIMNRGLREEFERTPRRAVLVPACMRGARAGVCRAHVKDTDITCAACDPTCTVNRITRRVREAGGQVFLVPHSTGFSRWLKRWQTEPDCGVTAVACLLNILSGGYEMRARGIASQCVPLDYPGCQKHWHREGVATALNEGRLVQIVASSRLETGTGGVGLTDEKPVQQSLMGPIS